MTPWAGFRLQEPIARVERERERERERVCVCSTALSDRTASINSDCGCTSCRMYVHLYLDINGTGGERNLITV